MDNGRRGARPRPGAATVRRWRRRLADERAEAAVYRHLAGHRSGEEREILLGVADAEERHALHWQGLLGAQVGPPLRSGFRPRLLALLAKRFGSVFVLALAQRAESRSPYDLDPDATRAMAADEAVHEEVVRGLAARGRAQVSGTFRAAVFGANDGLVSNLALVLGVSGGGVATRTVLLTGLAGLLSGSLSMGAGEYVSVRSQRELLSASSPGPGARAAAPHLDVDANELALVYRARGVEPAEAERRAAEVLSGVTDVDPAGDEGHDIVGTGLRAAAASAAFFASGAAMPVLPFVLGLAGGPALTASCLLVGLALLFTGAVVGVLSGGPPLRRALRQLGIGAGAAATTYVLGRLFGTALG